MEKSKLRNCGIILIKTNDFLNSFLFLRTGIEFDYDVIGFYIFGIFGRELFLWNSYDGFDADFLPDKLEKILTSEFVQKMALIPLKYGVEKKLFESIDDFTKKKQKEEIRIVYQEVISGGVYNKNGINMVNRILSKITLKKNEEYIYICEKIISSDLMEEETILERDEKLPLLFHRYIYTDEFFIILNKLMIEEGRYSEFLENGYLQSLNFEYIHFVEQIIDSINNGYIDIFFFNNIIDQLSRKSLINFQRINKIRNYIEIGTGTRLNLRKINLKASNMDHLISLRNGLLNSLDSKKINFGKLIEPLNRILPKEERILLKNSFLQEKMFYFFPSIPSIPSNLDGTDENSDFTFYSSKDEYLIELGNIDFRKLNEKQLYDLINQLEKNKYKNEILDDKIKEFQDEIMNYLDIH